METVNAKFSGNVGDMISLIPAMNRYYELFGKKIILCLRLNVSAQYYAGARHPVVDGNGIQVMLNGRMFESIKPLMMAQPCIEDVVVFKGQEKIKLDFDRLYEIPVGKPNGSINRWPFYIYPNLATDLSVIWATVPDPIVDSEAKGKIVITRTERWQNQLVHYFFLREYQDDLIFVGLEYEHEMFCQQFNLDIPFLKTNNFLELAQAIKQCRFFMSNQTAAFQIAEGLKVPRILEKCEPFPNVIPIGHMAVDFKDQLAFEYYFKFFYEKTHQPNYDGASQSVSLEKND